MVCLVVDDEDRQIRWGTGGFHEVDEAVEDPADLGDDGNNALVALEDVSGCRARDSSGVRP
ncbi:MAG: hypothetical protein WKF31_04205 [Thermoleophilaceae bacterium]